MDAKDLVFFGSVYLSQYQLLPAHCGMVLVSRQANFLHFGHLVSTHFFMAAKGDSPVPVGSYFFTFGSFTGKSFSGTGTILHLSQCMSGIGSPQYLCRENSQSRSLYFITILPSTNSVIFLCAY